MPYFKFTITYLQFNQQFSEIWYQELPNLTEAVDFATIGLMNPFVAFRDNSCVLYKLRISDVANNRSSTVLAFNLPGQSVLTGADVTNTTALITITSPLFGASRKVWCRGLSDNDVMRNPNSGQSVPSPFLLQGLNKYIDNIVNNQFLVRSNTKISQPPVQPFVKQKNCTISAVANTRISTIGTPGVVPPQYSYVELRMMDPKIWPGLNGIYQVSQTFGASFNIDYNSPVPLANVPLTGYVRPVVYQYGSVQKQGSSFQIFTSRKTGKNSTGGRGARSAQRLRLAQ